MTTVSLDKRQLVEISPIYAASEGGSERSTKIARCVSRHPLQIGENGRQVRLSLAEPKFEWFSSA